MAGFVHLHVHSQYSLLDGACRIEGLVRRAAELGQPAVALTDHGVMYGAVEFYKAARKAGVRPIIGCEVYVAARTRHDKVYGADNEHCHLVLLCENNVGYQNLLKLVSCAWTEGFYGKPRVDRELLERYHEGLIALSACLAGEIPRALMGGDHARACATAQYYADLFGPGNFYLELQDHRYDEQRRINPLLVRLSNETGIPLVCTNDVHYLTREDAAVQKALVCIQTGTTLAEPSSMVFETEEFYLKSEQEMRALFPSLPAAFDNTVDIAERCQVELEFGQLKLPTFDVPGGDSTAYFERLCREGLVRRYGAHPPEEAVSRLEYELSVIKQMGYVDYYLIVNDFVQYARSHDIPVGPGRGSGAGSLCAYCIGITAVDPLKYQLLFERFLNPERVSMPDFDIDFCAEKRGQVIDYVIGKYGADRVSQIITFGTMAARAAVRDVARVMALPYATADRIAKLIPFELNMTLEKALGMSKPLQEAVAEDPQIAELFSMASRLEGMPRNASTHAAGVVISPRPVSDFVPLCLNSDAVATQYQMKDLEELGVLKMDFLGLRNLTILDAAVRQIRRTQPDFSLDTIPIDAAPVYEMLAAGNSEGVFQLESAGMKRVLTGLRPERFEDIIAVIALFRPGPMDSIPKYIHNRHHPHEVRYLHESLRPILDVTYGCIVYQEQVMQIFRDLGGYSLGRADVVRRAMAKKKHDVMERERDVFLQGCISRGIPARTAGIIFDDMSSFASYAFNKSHAAAYAVVAYQTAYLKCFYPKEYMAALLTGALGTGKLPGYINECRRLGIRVAPPSVNESVSDFAVVGKDIRFGLLAVKNIGRGLVEELVREREQNGPYRNFYDFCKRLSPARDFNRRALDSLIRCGALDGLGTNRRQMLEAAEAVVSQLEEYNRRQVDGQLGLFDMLGGGGEQPEPVTYANVPELPFSELLEMEREVAGLYLSGHPMQPWQAWYNSAEVTRIDAILGAAEEGNTTLGDGASVCLLGMAGAIRLQKTKSGASMGYAPFEDLFGRLEVILFPKVYERYRNALQSGTPVMVEGRIDWREDEPPRLLADRVRTAPAPEAAVPASPPPAAPRVPEPTASKGPSARHGWYVRLPSQDSREYRRMRLLTDIFDGDEPLYIRFLDTGKMVRAPREMWIDPNDVLFGELCRVLGSENVAIVR